MTAWTPGERVVGAMKRDELHGHREGARTTRMSAAHPSQPFHLVPAGSDLTVCGLAAEDFGDDISGRGWEAVPNFAKCADCRAGV